MDTRWGSSRSRGVILQGGYVGAAWIFSIGVCKYTWNTFQDVCSEQSVSGSRRILGGLVGCRYSDP